MSSRMAKVKKKSDNINSGEDIEKPNYSWIAGMKIK